jgi:hypothetical protein
MNEEMIDKQEAYRFLNVSESTLERFVRQGRLTPTYRKGRTRPVPQFALSALTALREELETARPSHPAVPVAVPPEAVSFRLSPDHMVRLTDAAARHGMSVSAYARHLVLDALEGGAEERVRDDIRRLAQLTRLIAEDIASSTLALLLHGGKEQDENQARAWVEANLKSLRAGSGED